MHSSRRLFLIGSTVLVAGVLAGCTGWRLSTAARLARHSEPFEAMPPDPARRLLVVGDSTAVGTGASSPATSVAGRIGHAHPDWAITNRAEDGARMVDVVTQLTSATGTYDLVLLMAGGNDVIRLTSAVTWRRELQAAVRIAGGLGRDVVVMPCGNVGHAPFFLPPLSWWMSARSRRLHEITAEVTAVEGARYVKLLLPKDHDPFAQAPARMHAADGLHPSDAGYRAWYDMLQAQGGLA